MLAKVRCVLGVLGVEVTVDFVGGHFAVGGGTYECVAAAPINVLDERGRLEERVHRDSPVGLEEA
jgi:Cys-tRNA synthase (O-phospho-L-seryl-tRNA:Cys-tRNA synthase)